MLSILPLVFVIHAHLLKQLLLVIVLHSRVVLLSHLGSLVEQKLIVLHLHIGGLLSL